MKLLYVHSGADLYGASRSLLRLAECCVKDGQQVWVVLPESGQLRAALERIGAEVIVQRDLAVVSRVKGGAVISVLVVAVRLVSSSWRLVRTCRRLRPDIVHSNTATVLSGAVAARIAGVPHVWHIREIFGEFPLSWSCHRWLMGFCSAKIICISEAVAKQFNRSAAEKKIEIIYDGLPAQDYAPPIPQRVRDFRSRFNIAPEARVAAVVGRIKFGRKGQETFVRAAARIADRIPNAVFLLIGTAFPGNEDHTRRLKELVDELHIADRVVFTGEIEDMRVAYSAMDLLVLPSGLPEPFGLVLIEAMSFGKPVIGTSHGGAPEIIEDGRCGYLVPPNCPEKMAEAMERVLSSHNLSVRLGNNGRQRALELFSFASCYESIQSSYSALAQRPTPAAVDADGPLSLDRTETAETSVRAKRPRL